GQLLQAQEETLLLRNPSVSQSHVAFVYGGDIWIADKSGANARRLTSNPGVELNPIFSPDGQRIAFTGNYDGNTDVYTISIYGGDPQRVTFHPAADILRGWINDKEVYITRSRVILFSFGARFYTTDLNGDLASGLTMQEAYQGATSEAGLHWA